jgi:hypothetical protein
MPLFFKFICANIFKASFKIFRWYSSSLDAMENLFKNKTSMVYTHDWRTFIQGRDGGNKGTGICIFLNWKVGFTALGLGFNHWEMDKKFWKWEGDFSSWVVSDSSFRYNCLKSNKLIFQIKIIKLFLIIK